MEVIKLGRRVAVLATGQTKYVTKRLDVNMPEMVFEAAYAALSECDLSPAHLDAVIFAIAPETFDGVDSPDKWCADAAAAWNKPYMRIHTGGSTGSSGALAAITHIASGIFDIVLVLGIQRVSQTPDAQLVLNLTFDPIFGRGSAMNLISCWASDAVEAMQRYKFSEWHMAKISAKNHQNALNNPFAHVRLDVSIEDCLKSPVVCWPLKLLDCCPRSDGACAVVFASEEKATRLAPKPAWVQGYAGICIQDVQGEIGREQMAGYGLGARRAYKMAGITDPLKEIDVAEPYLPFSSMEVVAYHQLGFCEEPTEAVKLVERGFGEMNGEVPFNPSGGVLCSNPIGATGLVRVAEASLQIMGKAEKRQVPDVRRALATGQGGAPGPMSASFTNAFVLGVDKP
jgi:acetyl-CoA C-acetyltransferase